MGVFCAAWLALCLTGCLTVGPDYEMPDPGVPDAWRSAALQSLEDDAAPLAAWWEVFDDPVLVELIAAARERNRDLGTAAARVTEARALLGSSRSGFFPQVDGRGAVTAQRASEATTPSLPPGIEREDTLYSAGFGLGWELDLFGRVRRSVESARASYEASLEDYRDVLVLLYAEVASAYIDTRALQARIAYAWANVDAQRETLQLTRDRRAAGLAPELDVSQAELNLASTQATIPALRAQLAQTLSRLAVLIGSYPGELPESVREAAAFATPEAGVAAGLPADLLRQRPDIRRAERRLAAQHARIGVARAELYPIFSLPGSFALEAFDAGDLDGGSLTYGFGPSFRWNLFTGGRVRSAIRAEEARTQQALLQYEQTVLRAVSEVESAMTTLAEERERRDALQRAVEAAGRAVVLVQTLYKSGLTDFQNVLDLERSLAAQQDALAESEGRLNNALVRLYAALGGGWVPGETGEEGSMP